MDSKNLCSKKVCISPFSGLKIGNPATSGLVLHWCHHNPYTILPISTPVGYSVSVHLVDCPFLPLLIGWSSTSEKEAGWGHLPRSHLYTSPANRHFSSSWNGKFTRTEYPHVLRNNSLDPELLLHYNVAISNNKKTRSNGIASASAYLGKSVRHVGMPSYLVSHDIRLPCRTHLMAGLDVVVT